MPDWLQHLRDEDDDESSAPDTAAAADARIKAPPAGGPAEREAAPQALAGNPNAQPVQAAQPTQPAAGKKGRQAAPESVSARLGLWDEHGNEADEADRRTVHDIRQHIFDATREMPPEAADRLAKTMADQEAARAVPDRARQERIVAEALSTMNGRFGAIDPLLHDPGVTEILINAPHEIYTERAGRLHREKGIRFLGDPEVRSLVDAIAVANGRKFDWATPILDAHLPDGSRVAAVRWSVAPRGTAVAIRRFPVPYTFEDMVRSGSLPPQELRVAPSFLGGDPYPAAADVADVIRWLIRRRVNVLVSGSTGAGKTTLLNALLSLVDPALRVIIIEDLLELQPPRGLHVVRLERRTATAAGVGEVSLRELLTASLRLRPDIIVVGECRRNETAVMIEAMSTGHDGSLTTVHADSPFDAMNRLVRMVRDDYPNMPSVELRAYLASAIHAVVHFRRDLGHPGGRRIVAHLAAVEGLDEHGDFAVTDLFRWEDGCFRPTGAVPRWAAD